MAIETYWWMRACASGCSRMSEPCGCEGSSDRRQAASGVDEDRNAALCREREDGCEPLVVEQELLGARMKLDPAGAEIEAAARLLDRPLVEREPHEWDEAAV